MAGGDGSGAASHAHAIGGGVCVAAVAFPNQRFDNELSFLKLALKPLDFGRKFSYCRHHRSGGPATIAKASTSDRAWAARVGGGDGDGDSPSHSYICSISEPLSSSESRPRASFTTRVAVCRCEWVVGTTASFPCFCFCSASCVSRQPARPIGCVEVTGDVGITLPGTYRTASTGKEHSMSLFKC